MQITITSLKSPMARMPHKLSNVKSEKRSPKSKYPSIILSPIKTRIEIDSWKDDKQDSKQDSEYIFANGACQAHNNLN